MTIQFYIPGDIILKEGNVSSNFFFIHEGLCEVLVELEDFLFFDFQQVKQFIAHEVKDQNQEDRLHLNDQDYLDKVHNALSEQSDDNVEEISVERRPGFSDVVDRMRHRMTELKPENLIKL